MNLSDEIIDEVRAVREAYAARFNFDLAEMYKDLKTKEKACDHKMAQLVPVQPQPIARRVKPVKTPLRTVKKK
jgi:hypothetical protein